MADSTQHSLININRLSKSSRYAQWMLLALLVAQIIFIIWSRVDGSSDESDQQAIINLERSQVKQVLIEKKNFPEFKMQRLSGNWVLPDRNNTKVSTEKVDVFLTKLLRIKSSWPIANTQTSIQEFHVAASNYVAKIELNSNTEQHVALFLGLSPGVNSTYARIDGTNAVYKIPFNTLDLSINHNDWLNEEDSQPQSVGLENVNNPIDSNSQLEESKN